MLQQEKLNYQMITLSCMVIMVGLLSRDIYLPSMPVIAGALLSTPMLIASSITACLIGDGIAELIYGPLSDSYGRKKIILLGMIICCVGNLIACFVTSGTAFWLSRFITGFGVGAFPVATRAMARDSHQNARLTKTIAYFSMAATLSPIIAPMIGGYLQVNFNWRANFIFLVFITSICFFFIRVKSTETNQQCTNQFMLFSVIQNYKQLILDKQLLSNAMLSAIAFSFSITFFMISPFIFQTELGLSPSENGMLYIFLGLGFFIGAFSAAKLAGHVGEHYLLLSGIVLCFVGSFLCYFFYRIHLFNATSVMLSSAVCVVGAGLITPIANKRSLNPFPYAAGYAAAILGLTRMLVVFLIGFPVSCMHIASQLQLAWLFGALSFLALLIYGVIFFDFYVGRGYGKSNDIVLSI